MLDLFFALIEHRELVIIMLFLKKGDVNIRLDLSSFSVRVILVIQVFRIKPLCERPQASLQDFGLSSSSQFEKQPYVIKQVSFLFEIKK